MTNPTFRDQPYRTPTEAEHAALEAFALAHGRKWRDTLTQVYWYNARIWHGPRGERRDLGTTLHGIRNEFGPTWLYDVYCPRTPENDAQLFRAVRALGMTIRKRDREYRVTYVGIPADRAEAVACYTNDRRDALDTAHAMAKAGYQS